MGTESQSGYGCERVNTSPLVSVVMAVFNGEKYLQRAIDSILAQTLTDFEFIIVDDGSTDRGKDIIRRYHDDRIRLIENSENLGLSASLNKGIEVARSGYVARMDCDDISLPERFALQFEFLERHSRVAVLGTGAKFIDADGVDVCTFAPLSDDNGLRRVFPESPFIHPSVMFRKSMYLCAGRYPEHMRWGGEDAVLFGRMANFGELHNLATALLKYRLVPGAMSRKPPDFRDLLTQIVADEIAGNSINDKRLKKLQELAKRIDKSAAAFDYHFEVAKLYLWSGGDGGRSRAHLRRCFELRHISVKLAGLYLISFLPSAWVRDMYVILKGRRFDSA